MKFLEEPQLEFISNVLTNYQIGDRVLNGRLEAFSCALFCRCSAAPA